MRRNFTKTGFSAAGLILLAFIGNTTFGQPFIKKNEILTASGGRWSAMSFAVGGKIYAGGGYNGNAGMIDWQEYDPAANTWTYKPHYMPGSVANRSAGITFVINGKAYLGLGAEHFLSITLPTKQLADLWSYDPATDTWTQKASLPGGGRNSSSVFVINNKAYIVGGQTGPGTLTNEVWEYDPANDKWTSKPSFPGGSVRNAVGFGINNKGYVTGGIVTGQTTPLKKLYEFNGSAWTPKADFPADTAREGAVAFVVNNKAYFGLGGTYAGYPTAFFTYDPTTDTWAFLTGKWPVQSRMYGRAEVIGNKAYMGMGWRLDGGSAETYFKDWYEVDAAGLLDVVNVAQEQTTIQAYPNPTSGILHLKGDFAKNAVCNIYTIDGRKAGTEKLELDNTIDLRSYPAGKYILKVSTETTDAASIIEVLK